MARIVVLTPNPAIDVTYRVAEQRLGETVRVADVSRRPGGKGLNVVAVLRLLGSPAVALQPLGGAPGRWMAESLLAAGTEVVVVDAPGDTRTTVAVVDDRTHPTLYSEPGEALPGATWRALADAVAQHCEAGGFLVLSGSVPPATAAEHVRHLVVAAHGVGARVLVDTSGDALLAAADAGADIVKPNEAEALEATGTGAIDAAAAALIARGAGTVVISRGDAGLCAIGADGDAFVQPAVPDVSGNPTGAGDAATAGLIAALLRGGDIAEALRWASVVGAAAVLSPVAGDIDPADLRPLADRLPTGARPTFPATEPTFPPAPVPVDLANSGAVRKP
ncbi:1-phosphofructokinase family hexose kinase [Planctomonas psychrotolerans]|uniref:1-phosphofructokinase family hexose kinase n=1 Tax=Planctomonas psychrotolerans TaxID=2528712 RepID=UPI00123BEA48|nr:hexose kinase [Planctomonas psychrotolerans]